MNPIGRLYINGDTRRNTALAAELALSGYPKERVASIKYLIWVGFCKTEGEFYILAHEAACLGYDSVMEWREAVYCVGGSYAD